MGSHLFRIIQVVNAGGDGCSCIILCLQQPEEWFALNRADSCLLCNLKAHMVVVMSKGHLQSQFFKKYEFLNGLFS